MNASELTFEKEDWIVLLQMFAKNIFEYGELLSPLIPAHEKDWHAGWLEFIQQTEKDIKNSNITEKGLREAARKLINLSSDILMHGTVEQKLDCHISTWVKTSHLIDTALSRYSEKEKTFNMTVFLSRLISSLMALKLYDIENRNRK